MSSAVDARGEAAESVATSQFYLVVTVHPRKGLIYLPHGRAINAAGMGQDVRTHTNLNHHECRRIVRGILATLESDS